MEVKIETETIVMKKGEGHPEQNWGGKRNENFTEKNLPFFFLTLQELRKIAVVNSVL